MKLRLVVISVVTICLVSLGDTAFERAESFYGQHRWSDAEPLFLSCAARVPNSVTAADALVKAGVCRVKTRDFKGARALFLRVIDARMVKIAPDPSARAFDQLHRLLIKQNKSAARESLALQCRKLLPRHVTCAHIFEREGDMQLEGGKLDKARKFYSYAEPVLSKVGADILVLLSLKGNARTLTQSDADRLARVAEVRPSCALALCKILAGCRDDWRAEDVRARIYLKKQNYEEAVATWENLVKVGKGPVDAFSLAIAETKGFKTGDSLKAVLLYDAWLAKFLDSPLREKAEYQRAGAIWMAGKIEAASEAFEAFLSRYPKSSYCQEARRVLVRINRDLEAAQKTGFSDAASEELARAESVLREGRAAEAMRIFSRFKGQQTHKQWGRAWYGYGLCRRALGEPEKAVAAWDEVLRRAATRTNTLCAVECRRVRADTLFDDLANPAEALSDYLALRGIILNERAARDIEERIALALLALGRGKEARPLLEAFRKRESGNPVRVLYWDGLIAICNRSAPVVTSAGGRIESLLRLAEVCFSAKRWDAASARYRDVIRSSSDSELIAYAEMQHARCVARCGKLEQALSIYDLFLKKYSRSTWADDALLRAGVLCAGPLGDTNRAQRYFSEILRKHPNGDKTEIAHIYLATLAWWAGDWGEAERQHRDFLERYPTSAFREEILGQRLPAIAAHKKGMEK